LAAVDRDRAGTGDRVDQFADVQGIPASFGGEPAQPFAWASTDRVHDHVDDLVVRQAGQDDLSVGGAPQSGEIVTSGRRPGQPGDQQRLTVRRAEQPAQGAHRGRIGPVQIVDDQQHRACLAHVGDQRQHAGCGRSDAAYLISRDRGSPQPLGDLGMSVGVAAQRSVRCERVKQREQGKCLAQLLAVAPEDLTTEAHRLGPCDPHQFRLADTWLALDHDRPATALGKIRDEALHLNDERMSTHAGSRVHRVGHEHQPIAMRR
jgi:hypothetical protein